MRNLLDLKKVGAQVGLGLIYVRKAVLEKFWKHVVDRSALDFNLQNHLPLLATLTTGKSKYISSRGGHLCASYVSVPRRGHLKTPGMDLICTFPRPHLLGRALIWSGHFGSSRTFGLFVKVCWISFSSWKSFIGFYILSYPLSTILACSFTVGVRIS